jgi:hypothetical protein
MLNKICKSLVTTSALLAAPAFSVPIMTGTVNISSWSSLYFNDADTASPSVSGFGLSNNSLVGAFGPSENEVSQNYFTSDRYPFVLGNATATLGEATSYPASTLLPAFDTYGDGIFASTSLNLDMSTAATGTMVNGVTTTASTLGVSFDGSDGATDGAVSFTVNFTIDASVSGANNVDGSFGIQVDVFSPFTSVPDDLFTSVTPYVTGTGIPSPVDMVELLRTDAQGDAWTFALTDEDIAAAGGNINGEYTAHFSFAEPTDGAFNAFYVSLAAFGRIESATAVPEPSSLIMLGLGLTGLVTRRRMKKSGS